MTKQNENQQFLSNEELSKLEQCIKSGFSNLQAIYETGIAEERFDLWYIHFGGAELIKRWRVMRTAPALKLFHDPQNHKEAEAVLKRHPDTKKEYSERTEGSVDLTLGNVSDEDLRKRAAEIINAIIS